MTTMHMADYRNEDRSQSASYVDGEPQKQPSTIGLLSYYGQHKIKENIEASYAITVKDSRTVSVGFDSWGDTPYGEVPELLEEITDDRLHLFHVDRVRFVWVRKFTGDNADAQWQITDSGYISVSGDNYRKDGSRGQITGATRFPKIVQRKEDTGKVKTEKYFGKPYEELPTYQQKWWGDPVFQTFYDRQPLPAWLQTIVDLSHPVTGKNPFTFGDEHVYGRFGDD